MRYLRRSIPGFLLLGLAGALPLQASAQTFTTRILAHVPRNVNSVSLNDQGWATWTTGLGNDSQVYLWAGSNVLTLGFPGRNNRDSRINNNDWVVWSSLKLNAAEPGYSEIYVWRGEGTPENLSAALDTSAEPVINNKNDIAWWSSHEGIKDVYYLPHNTNGYQNLTILDPNAASEMPQIDNNGFVSWVRTVEIAPDIGASNLVFAPINDTSEYTQVTFRDDLNVYNYGLTDNGKLVWETYNDTALKWEVWEYDRTTNESHAIPGSLSQFYSPPAVRQDGTIAFPVYITSLTYKLYWNRNGVTEPIPITTPYTQNRPVTLNNKGQILFATGNSSATGFDIVLATPSDAAPAVSGAIRLEDIVANAESQCVTLTFRPSDNSPVFTRRVMLAPTGAFTVYDVPKNNYVVNIKGKKWLAANINVNTMGGNVITVNQLLKAGDANDDNVVDVFDLDALISAFDSTPDAANWNDGAADFNCDGSVDVLDLDLLIRNFDAEGAP